MRETTSRLDALEARARQAEEISELLDSLLSRTLEKIGEPARKRAVAAGRHPWIALARPAFVFGLRNVRRLLGDEFEPVVSCPRCGVEEVGSPSFVDVGCGVGDKLALASDLGFEAHGIEVDPAAVRKARRAFRFRVRETTAYSAPPLLHEPGGGAMTLYPVDARDFDLSGFAVIYFYRPFADDRRQRSLERRIWKQARPGAFVIACGALTRPPRSFRELRGLDGERPEGMVLYRRTTPL
jgi:SAM-dependent methyltransferase